MVSMIKPENVVLTKTHSVVTSKDFITKTSHCYLLNTITLILIKCYPGFTKVLLKLSGIVHLFKIDAPSHPILSMLMKNQRDAAVIVFHCIIEVMIQ